MHIFIFYFVLYMPVLVGDDRVASDFGLRQQVLPRLADLALV